MIGSAVVPVALCITWSKCNGTGATVGAILGFVAGVAGWLGITANLNGGVINVDTTFGDYEMLTGNLLAIGVGGIITVVWSVLKPSDFDWEITRAINRKIVESDVVVADRTPQESPSLETPGEKMDKDLVSPQQRGNAPSTEEVEAQQLAEEGDEVGLQKAFRLAAWTALILVFVLIFLIPLPLFFTSYGQSSMCMDERGQELMGQCTRRKALPPGSAFPSSGCFLVCSWSACILSLRLERDLPL